MSQIPDEELPEMVRVALGGLFATATDRLLAEVPIDDLILTNLFPSRDPDTDEPYGTPRGISVSVQVGNAPKWAGYWHLDLLPIDA